MAKSCTLNELAGLVGGEVIGNGDLSVRGLNGIQYAAVDEITFITSAKRKAELAGCKAAAAVIPINCDEISMPCIKVRNPDLAATIIHNHFIKSAFRSRGIHQFTSIGNDCRIPDNVTIGPMVSIGDRVTIGEKVTLYPGVVIGSDCTIGNETVLHANVNIADHTRIGKRVIIHSGASIGSDGFGYATDEQGRHLKKPQVGNVQIDDDVEIGANSCVDRAAFGTTRINRGVKIDNLVMIAHNVVIGENAIVVAQAGIAGSTNLGKNVVLGAQSGVAGHLNIGDKVMVAAKSGIHGSLKEGSVVAGYPAIDIAKWRKAIVSFTRLPEMLKEIKILRHRLDLLEQRLKLQGKEKDQEMEEK